MNDQELLQRISNLEQKLDEANASLARIKSYFKWTFIITVLVIVLPLIGLAFAIPSFLNTLTTINSF